MTTTTLATLLDPDAVAMATLHERYGAVLELVRVLIGVVPNCDAYLEIWPPAFRTYNIMVPNFLNLPFSLVGVGGPPASIVGLGMYVASRIAECPYCSAHSCSFALRRGAVPEKVAQALAEDSEAHTARERATIAVARSIAAIPCELTGPERSALEREFGAANAEWVVAGITMMGFLNKFMDAIGVELESSTHAEVVETMGKAWSAGTAGRNLDRDASPSAPPRADSLATKVRILPYLPTALRLDRQWQRGMPDKWPAIGEYLREHTGHDFPVLGRLRHPRFARAAASMIHQNTDASTSVLGLPIKVLAGVVFCAVVHDRVLDTDVRALALAHRLDSDRLGEVRRYATHGGDVPGGDQRERALLELARAISPSPAVIDERLVSALRAAGIEAAAIVEMVTWIAVLQMLHRLESWFDAGGGA